MVPPRPRPGHTARRTERNGTDPFWVTGGASGTERHGIGADTPHPLTQRQHPDPQRGSPRRGPRPDGLGGPALETRSQQPDDGVRPGSRSDTMTNLASSLLDFILDL